MRGVNTYNGFVAMDVGVKEAWAQVENQYQRRIDLIPGLVEIVKGAAAHEKDTLTAVVEARAKATQTRVDINDAASLAKFQANQGELSSALSRLMMITENYPTLQANQNFMNLQAQLEGTENRIAVERKRYNEVVQAYNTAIRVFPANFIADRRGFKEAAMFAAEEGADKAPDISFEKKGTASEAQVEDLQAQVEAEKLKIELEKARQELEKVKQGGATGAGEVGTGN